MEDIQNFHGLANLAVQSQKTCLLGFSIRVEQEAIEILYVISGYIEV